MADGKDVADKVAVVLEQLTIGNTHAGLGADVSFRPPAPAPSMPARSQLRISRPRAAWPLSGRPAPPVNSNCAAWHAAFAPNAPALT